MMDQVNEDHEPVIVTLLKGKPVVMVSLEDWATMDETTYLLATPANRQKFLKSIEQLNAGKRIMRAMLEE